MDVHQSIITSLDVHQLLYDRPSVKPWTSVFIVSELVPLRTSISFHLDIHHLCGHPSAIKRTTIRTSVDVHQLSYGCPSVFHLTSVNFYIDVHQYLSRRPSAFMRTPISTSVDIHQFSSRHPSSLETSISYQTDIPKNLCDHPSAFYGRPSVFKLTSVSFYIDVHHYLSGRLPAFTWTSISTTLDVCFIGNQLVPLVFPSVFI